MARAALMYLHHQADQGTSCLIGSSALMRQALVQALHHVRHRHAFGHALQREPACRQAFFDELGAASGGHALLDAERNSLAAMLDSDATMLEAQSRWLAERMALALQASILVRGDDPMLADAFCESRLGMHRGLAFGTPPLSVPVDHLIERAWPG